MSAQQNPFSQFAQAFGDFQNSFSSNFGDNKNIFAKNVSFDQLPSSQQIIKNARKNYEAFSDASKAVMDLTQTLTRHSSEYTSQVAEAMADFLEQSAQIKSPQEGFEKQARFAKEMSEHAMSNGKEVSELVNKSGTEVTEIVSSRFSEVLGEISDVSDASVSPANTDSSAKKKKAA